MQGYFPRFRDSGRLFCLLSAVILLCHSLPAAEIPSTWLDDAYFNDVRLIGSKLAFAVGEHGAVCKSTDGGRTWATSSCGQDVSLQSVCFLDDRVGWIAGSENVAYAGLDRGVLLATHDGGSTWQRIENAELPALRYVKFFGMEEGLVVGQPTALSPAGIFKTSDGGKTWHGVQGEAPQAWKGMCFLEPEMGIVAGVNGTVSLMGGDQLYPSKLQPQGFRSVRAISLLPDDTGWLAGDGGLVLKTSTGGVVWESPAKPLPEELRDGIDFRAVEVREEKVWLGGAPGSAIWHSPDGGKHWEKQLTGETAPLASIRFSHAQQGIAVGAFGVILRTDDGGKTWQGVRGRGRRAAVLSLHTTSGRTSPPFLAKLSGEMGYRSAVWVAQRDDVGPLALSATREALLQSAVQKCGGHAAEVNWQLPQLRPGVEFAADQLLLEWQRQTEGRLPQTLMGGIVRQIRTWRPNVIILDQPSSDDAAGQLLFDASLRGVAQAADATRYVEQTELTGLECWKVDRVYLRLAAGGTGDVHVDLDEFLPYRKTSTRNAAAPAISMLQGGRVPLSEVVPASRLAYRWIDLEGNLAESLTNPARGKGGSGLVSRDFFGGGMVTPGSAARREMLPLDEANLDRMQKLVEKQRNLTGVFQKSLDDPRLAGQMIGQINGMIEGMEPAQAVALLRDLADEYRKRSEYELVESTYVELIRKYPREPGSLDAMRWLIQFWSSSETAWQRTRMMKSDSSVNRTNPRLGSGGIQQAGGARTEGNDVRLANLLKEEPASTTTSNSGSPTRLDLKLDFDASTKGNRKNKKQEKLKVVRDTSWRTGAVGEWHARASELAKQLQASEPSLFQSPEIQFPLAAMRRSEGSTRAGDALIRNFVTHAINLETKQLAERELWASFATPESPKGLVLCYPTANRPHLDGLLSDPCWGDANELHLTAEPSATEAAGSNRNRAVGDGTDSLVMFAYDAEHFYVALRVPRAKGTTLAPVQSTGRQHDEDLSRYDRISVRLDLDRDYATWYEFQIDQRGCTAESCWEDRRWNPTWYVAAEIDQTDWRIEAAIPWSDLTPTPPHRGTICAVSILRTTPTVGLQSWNHPATARPQPASFGLLKFE